MVNKCKYKYILARLQHQDLVIIDPIKILYLEIRYHESVEI